MSTTNIKEAVREKYGEAALRVLSGETSSCCETSCCGDPIHHFAISITPIRLARYRKKRSKLRWVAEIPPHWPR